MDAAACLVISSVRLTIDYAKRRMPRVENVVVFGQMIEYMLHYSRMNRMAKDQLLVQRMRVATGQASVVRRVLLLNENLKRMRQFTMTYGSVVGGNNSNVSRNEGVIMTICRTAVHPVI